MQPTPDQSGSSPIEGIDTIDASVRHVAEYLARPLSAAELAEQTRRVSEPVERGMASPIALLIVHLGSERLAIPAAAARRVVRRAVVRRLPHRETPIFAGICNVDGRLLPAAHLDRLLGLERNRESISAARTVVLGDARGDFAVEVDRVEGVRRADAAAFIDPPATVARAVDRYVRALTEVGGAPAALLDADLLLAGLTRCLQ